VENARENRRRAVVVVVGRRAHVQTVSGDPRYVFAVCSFVRPVSMNVAPNSVGEQSTHTRDGHYPKVIVEAPIEL